MKSTAEQAADNIFAGRPIKVLMLASWKSPGSCLVCNRVVPPGEYYMLTRVGGVHCTGCYHVRYGVGKPNTPPRKKFRTFAARELAKEPARRTKSPRKFFVNM